MAEEKVANPGPLGLAAFAMTTFCLSCANAGWWHGDGAAAAFALALVYGGTAQLLAGMWEFVRKNTFAAVAFTSYGAFWIGLYVFLKIPAVPAGSDSLAIYLLGWTIFTTYMLVASAKVDTAVFVVFALLEVTFILLVLANFGHTGLTKAGGYFGLATALAAFYASAAGVINEQYGKVILPVG